MSVRSDMKGEKGGEEEEMVNEGQEKRIRRHTNEGHGGQCDATTTTLQYGVLRVMIPFYFLHDE